jgi:DNA repair protein RadC
MVGPSGVLLLAKLAATNLNRASFSILYEVGISFAVPRQRFSTLTNLGAPMAANREPPSPAVPETDQQLREQRLLERARQILLRRIRQGTCLSDPATVKDYLRLQVGHLEHEVFGCLFLDNQHAMIAAEDLFRGTIDGASVYPREVVKRALALNAAAVIFYHNHPSGVSEPSQSDQRLTQRLKAALGTVDIRVLDHFVVGSAEALSFSERGLL